MNSRLAIWLGVASIVVAGIVLAVALPKLGHDGKRRHPAAALASARAGCSAFDDVYEATRPGTPTDGDLLARRLEVAIDELRDAASEDPKWTALADVVSRTGNAVNAGDTDAAAAGIADVHDRCAAQIPRTG